MIVHSRLLLSCIVASGLGIWAALARVGTPSKPTPEATASKPETAEVEARAAPAPSAAPSASADTADEFSTLELRPEEQRLLAELERIGPPRFARALAEILISGYHNDELAERGVHMPDFAAERLAVLDTDPASTLRLLRSALQTPSLENPELAYARGTVFALAARYPEHRREANDMAYRELTTRQLAPIPVIDAAAVRSMSPTELAALASRPDIAAASLAHSVLIDTAPDAESALRGTFAAMAAHPSPALHRQWLGQLVDRYPELLPRVEGTLAELGPNPPAERGE